MTILKALGMRHGRHVETIIYGGARQRICSDLPMKKALTSIQPLTVVNRYININLAGFLSVLSVFTSLNFVILGYLT